jgi:hypothetical protein
LCAFAADLLACRLGVSLCRSNGCSNSKKIFVFEEFSAAINKGQPPASGWNPR